MINKIYIAGCLTSLTNPDLKKVYEKIGGVCQNFCDNVYVPHTHGTDPVEHPDVTPEEVWTKDYAELSSSDLLIAYVGQPSLGVGAELEIARQEGEKIILWWFTGEHVSRMARGNPAVVEKIEVKTADELYEKIKEVLKKY